MQHMQNSFNFGKNLVNNPGSTVWNAAQEKARGWQNYKRNLQYQQNQQQAGPGQHKCVIDGKYVQSGGVIDTEGVAGVPGGVLCQQHAQEYGLLQSSQSQATTAPKALEAEPKKINISLELRSLFNDDEDAAHDFLECLNDKELSIIESYPNDINKLKLLKELVENDVNETAKSLEMDN